MLYLKLDFTYVMDLSEELKDKQRVLFYGTNATELIALTSRILNKINKKHDVLHEKGDILSDAPLVLLSNLDRSLSHHILVVGELDEEQFNSLASIADATPKAGSIIFNKSDIRIAKVCEVKRTDVLQVPYKVKPKEDRNEKAVRALLTRIRVPELEIDNALT